MREDLLVRDLDLLFNPLHENWIKSYYSDVDIDLLRMWGFFHKFSDITDVSCHFEWNEFKVTIKSEELMLYSGISLRDTFIYELMKNEVFLLAYSTFYRLKRMELIGI